MKARAVPLLACVLVGCTGFDKPAYGQTSPAPSAAAVDSATAARRSLCERYVAVVSGRGDQALLDDPSVEALALQAPPDLVMCGAVVGDSDLLCDRLMPSQHGPNMACLHMRSVFHELRTYPRGRSFLFDDVDWRGCRSVPLLASRFCDPFRTALRSGDPKNCAATGAGESICRAYMNLDPSLCRLHGALKAAVSVGALVGVDFLDACARAIESRAFLAQGLQGLAESGPPREREFAKAALGDPEACASWRQAAMAMCMGEGAVTGVAGDTQAANLLAPADQERASQTTPPAAKRLEVPVGKQPRPTLTAEPNPVPAGARPGATMVSWNTGDGAEGRVRVSKDNAPERDFASGSQGAQIAEEIAAGSTYEFRLYDQSRQRPVLASITVVTTGEK